MRVKIPRREILRYFGWRFYTGCMMLLVLGFCASPAWAASESPQSFTYQGQLLDSSGHPMTGTVSVVMGIYSSSNYSCLLYEESLISLDLTPTQGLFSIAVGGPFDSNHARTALDPGLSLAQVFANTGAFTRAAGSPNCTAGYAPAPGDKRVLRLTVTPQGGTALSFDPGQTIDSAPQALVAETLQGIGPSGFLQPKASSNLSQTTLEQLTSAADASTLHNHDSQYAKLSASPSISLSSGSYLGLGSRATDPTGLGAGDVGKTWYDSTANVIKYWDGSAVKQLGVAGTGLTALTGDVSASGAGSVAATVNTVGGVTAANVALGANAANAATNANTVSTIVKRDASGNFSAGTITLGADPTLALQAATKQYVDTVNTNLTSAKVAKAGDTMTGALILPAGTATAPSLGVGSTGNGLYYPAVNQLGVSINGAEKVRIDSNGNVGVGTSAPLEKLQVGSLSAPANVALVRKTDNSSQGTIQWYNDAGGVLGGIKITGYRLGYGSADLLMLGGSNCAGGNASIHCPLTVSSYNGMTYNWPGEYVGAADSSLDASVGFGRWSSAAGMNDVLRLYNTGTAGVGKGTAISFDANRGTSTITKYGAIGMVVTDSGATTYKGDLVFETASGAARTEKVRIDSSGNVGIGTTVPNAKVAITSADYNAVSLANTNADATAKGAVITGSRSTNANVPYASFGTWDDGTYRYTMIGGGAFSRPDSTLITFYTASAYDETNGTGANERMRITSAGNVGIGINNPSQPLSVGSSSFSYFTVSPFGVTSNFSGTNGGQVFYSGSAGYGGLWLYTDSADGGKILFANGQAGYAWDTQLQRSGLKALTLDDGAGGAASLTVTGGANFATLSGNVGVGTTAPAAKLDVTGHIANTGSAAAVSACGTSPIISGNDTRGLVQFGTGTVTSCTITFAAAFATTPYCVISPYGGVVSDAYVSSVNTTTLVIGTGASGPGARFMYMCMQ